MKQPLFALACLCLALSAVPQSAAARPPTEGRFHLGAGFAYGDPFDEGLRPNPWGYGLVLRTGFTFNNGLYLGAMADFYLGEEVTVDGQQAQANAQLFGGVLGADLKLAATVAARLSLMGGIHNIEQQSMTAPPLPLSGQPFVSPSFELVMAMGDHFYLCPAARMNIFVADDFETAVTWSISAGASL